VRRAFFLKVTFLLALSPMLASVALAQSTGSVSGRVVDESTQRPLPGAAVKLNGATLSTDTDRAGVFQLLRVPAGRQTVTISYLGYEVASFDIQVRSGETVDLQATLKPLPQIKEYVEVRSDQLDGQARALNQQMTSPNIINVVSADQIGRFPDPNAAEATQRIPGIVIQRDQGEGRFVSVRGTEPRLNSVMINGERIPAPEDDVLLSSVLDPGYRVRNFLDGRYQPGNEFVNPAFSRNLLAQVAVEIEKDFEEDLADYFAKEKIGAAYLMAELLIGERLLLLPGLRYERTNTDYGAFQVLFDDDGDLSGVSPGADEVSEFPAGAGRILSVVDDGRCEA